MGLLYEGRAPSWEEREPVLSRWGPPALLGYEAADEARKALWDGFW